LDNVEAKVKELKTFLRKYGINYDRIEESTQSKLFLNEKSYISTRSGFYEKYTEFGLDSTTLEMIKKYLLEVSCAYDFEGESMEYEKQKLNTLLEKIDKTIKNKNLNVVFQSHHRFGGHTATRKEIVVYDPRDEPISEYMKIAPGINYHELGHVLFTCSFKGLAKDIQRKYPDYDSEFLRMTTKKREHAVRAVLDVVNALEDGRMENLMGNKYGGAIPYFRSTIFNFLLASIEESVDMGAKVTEFDCALIAGRKYIDYEFRKWVFDKYIECDEDHTEEKARRVNSYINKFITLTWRKNREEMLDLAMGFFFEFVKPELEDNTQSTSEWGDAMKDMLKGAGTEMNEMDAREDDDIDETEEQMMNKLLRDMLDEPKEQEEGKGQGDEKGEEEGKGSGKGDEKSDEKGEDGDEEGKGSGKGDEKSDEKGEDGDGGEGDAGPNGEKTGKSKGGDHDGDTNKESDNKVRQEMESARKQANEQVKTNSEALKSKLKNTPIKEKHNRRYDDRDVTMDMKKNEMMLEKRLKEFMRKCRNGYETRRRKGGVDIGEARRQSYRGGTRIFRQYRHNVQKALDIDVAFILDCSSSMSGGVTNSKMDEASRQLWIASTACKSVGAKVKIFTFSDYDLGTFEQPKNYRTKYRCPNTVCGTVIGDTMYKAESYLNASTSNTKWLISLTDGDIWDTDVQNQLLARLQRDDITCGKINLSSGRSGGYYGKTGDNDYDHVLNMTHDGRGNINMLNGDNIVTFFKKIYEVSLNRVGLE
jgi:hypothetical protein